MEEPAYGTIKIELYSNIAPKMVARFKELAKDRLLQRHHFSPNQPNGHSSRSIQTFQTSMTKNRTDQRLRCTEGDSGKPNVPAEFSDVPYETGIVGAARFGSDVNSANSQFFIMLKPEPQFNENYTIFGKVIEGMNNARTIAGVPKNGERPIDAVRIKTITIQPK